MAKKFTTHNMSDPDWASYMQWIADNPTCSHYSNPVMPGTACNETTSDVKICGNCNTFYNQFKSVYDTKIPSSYLSSLKTAFRTQDTYLRSFIDQLASVYNVLPNFPAVDLNTKNNATVKNFLADYIVDVIF